MLVNFTFGSPGYEQLKQKFEQDYPVFLTKAHSLPKRNCTSNDMVQNLYLKIFDDTDKGLRIRNHYGSGNIGYLFIIMINDSISAVRRGKMEDNYKAEVQAKTKAEPSTHNLPAGTFPPIIEAILQAALNDRQQEVLRLYGEGYSCREIAERIGTTENNISNIRHRSRQAIYKHLKGLKGKTKADMEELRRLLRQYFR